LRGIEGVDSRKEDGEDEEGEHDEKGNGRSGEFCYKTLVDPKIPSRMDLNFDHFQVESGGDEAVIN
jgi:hypothetical protein